MKAATRSLNIRLEENVYEALKAISVARGISMNKVVEEEILSTAERERKLRLKEAFARIADSSQDDQSVDFAFEAQREVVLGQE